MTGTSHCDPGLMPGPDTTNGTRSPPSKVEALPSLSGPLKRRCCSLVL